MSHAGELTADAIESLLHSEIFARIAYVDRRGQPYIVPITYAYDGRAIYGYSLLGAKVEFMRPTPKCASRSTKSRALPIGGRLPHAVSFACCTVMPPSRPLSVSQIVYEATRRRRTPLCRHGRALSPVAAARESPIAST